MSNRKYNIIEYLINYCEDNSPSPSDQDILDTWDLLLDKGFSANTETICCDECDLSGVTVFSSIEQFVDKYVEAYGLDYDGNVNISGLTCCISLYGNTESFQSVFTKCGLTGIPPLFPSNINDCPYLDFNTVLNRITSEFGYGTRNLIINEGVVLLGNLSIKCLLDYLDTKSENFRVLFLTKILDYGIVYNCLYNQGGSIETWLKYAEAVGLTSSAAVP